MAGVPSFSFANLFLAGLGSLLFYSIFLAVYRLYLYPIAKFPGPKLAAWSLWYEFYYDVVCGGQYGKKIAGLHDEYGRIMPTF